MFSEEKLAKIRENIAPILGGVEPLPTKPGEYYLVDVDPVTGEESEEEETWTLREDGVWVDPTGDSRPVSHNFILQFSNVKYNTRFVRVR